MQHIIRLVKGYIIQTIEKLSSGAFWKEALKRFFSLKNLLIQVADFIFIGTLFLAITKVISWVVFLIVGAIYLLLFIVGRVLYWVKYIREQNGRLK